MNRVYFKSFGLYGLFTVSIFWLITTTSSILIIAQENNFADSTGVLKIVITGFENNVGNCRFALDNSEDVFEREDSVWIGKVLPIENRKVVVEIDSLRYGEYAVRVFHDENKNTEVDTDIFGIPTENFGYSNNVSGWFGPPSWDRAKFIFNKDKMTIYIEID